MEDSSWKKEKVEAYLVYDKVTGKIWSLHMDREDRDKHYKELREEYPKAKLGRIKRITTRQDLLQKVTIKK